MSSQQTRKKRQNHQAREAKPNPKEDPKASSRREQAKTKAKEARGSKTRSGRPRRGTTAAKAAGAREARSQTHPRRLGLLGGAAWSCPRMQAYQDAPLVGQAKKRQT